MNVFGPAGYKILNCRRDTYIYTYLPAQLCRGSNSDGHRTFLVWRTNESMASLSRKSEGARAQTYLTCRSSAGTTSLMPQAGMRFQQSATSNKLRNKCLECVLVHKMRRNLLLPLANLSLGEEGQQPKRSKLLKVHPPGTL